MPATTVSCERSCSRSRPRLTARQELVEVDLERREDPVRPVLHLEPRLARLPAGVVDDLLRLPLGELHDLRLRRLAHRLLARLAEDPVGLALRLGQHLLPLLDDPARLLDLLRDRRAHLVEDVVDLLAVDPHLVGEGHGLRVVHEVVELVDENENVHLSSRESTLVGSPERRVVPFGNFSARRRATASGTSSSTFPPNAAISFTPLDETKLTCGARHHVDGLDLRREVTVQLVHLELPLEVGDHAQALDDHLRLPAARELDDELGEDVDLDVLEVRRALPSGTRRARRGRTAASCAAGCRRRRRRRGRRSPRRARSRRRGPCVTGS